VVAAVRAEVGASPAALERPGLVAAALALAAILDEPQHVAVQPAAARQLVAILGTLSKRTQRRGKLAVVKSMTTSSPSAWAISPSTVSRVPSRRAETGHPRPRDDCRSNGTARAGLHHETRESASTCAYRASSAAYSASSMAACAKSIASSATARASLADLSASLRSCLAFFFSMFALTSAT
jgi:hypothetical protein